MSKRKVVCRSRGLKQQYMSGKLFVWLLLLPHIIASFSIILLHRRRKKRGFQLLLSALCLLPSHGRFAENIFNRGVPEPSIKSDVTHSTKQFFTSLEATCDRIAKLFFMSFRAITIKTLLWFHVKLKATLRTLCMKHSGNQYVQRQIWFCGILANKQDQGFWQKENNCLVLTSPQRFSFLAKYDKFSWQINFKCHPLRNQLWTIR